MDSLKNGQVADTLTVLHEKAIADHISRVFAKERALEAGVPYKSSWNTAYMAVSSEEGLFLYFLAMVSKAKSIVEFGCSFGVSTIYLAAAAKNNGGWVVSTEIEPNKVEGATQNIASAGLSDYVKILQGDAVNTLATVKDPIDFLFFDGPKEMYLPVYQSVRSKLAKGAVIFADNADKPESQAFVECVRTSTSKFTTIQFFERKALIAYYK